MVGSVAEPELYALGATALQPVEQLLHVLQVDAQVLQAVAHPQLRWARQQRRPAWALSAEIVSPTTATAATNSVFIMMQFLKSMVEHKRTCGTSSDSVGRRHHRGNNISRS